ncbi:MAG TPA: TylF/MycF/NovP-related O-methyltransferase [Nitrospiraceae bacterium]|nr:TylF/MycF/NovP-related O-methyltransferase [Nitrospiraceae bacterium]
MLRWRHRSLERSLPKAVKVSSRDPFSPFAPFDPVFKERVPLVFLFQTALANLQFWQRGGPAPFARRIQAIEPPAVWYAAECGVYQGHALIALGMLARESGLPVHLYGLDTFEGLPELSQTDLELLPADSGCRDRVLFADTSLDSVQRRIDEKGLTQYITLVQGRFEDTLRMLPERRFFFVSIDCDLYRAHLTCLEYFYDRMIPGGIIYLDDYDSVEFPAARRAIDKFMEDRQERLFHLRYGEEGKNHTKAFVVKF